MNLLLIMSSDELESIFPTERIGHGFLIRSYIRLVCTIAQMNNMFGSLLDPKILKSPVLDHEAPATNSMGRPRLVWVLQGPN